MAIGHVFPDVWMLAANEVQYYARNSWLCSDMDPTLALDCVNDLLKPGVDVVQLSCVCDDQIPQCRICDVSTTVRISRVPSLYP